ncbi:MAG: hypothetical protein FD135_3559 [Comamonadaceae bacterium]|nr:MAG: hypothetical protein FD135_3559 [Comamonadaceae bacterium]
MDARGLTRRWFAAAVILGSACLLTVGAVMAAKAEAGGRIDVLEMPARLSDQAKSAVLNAVALAGQRVVAVGEMGIILLSDDNGQTWRQAKAVPTSVTLTNVRFATGSTGWAVGHSGVVLKTTDSGESWVRQLDGRQVAQIELVAADAAMQSNAETGARRQRDAQRMVTEGADKPFLDVYFFDEQNGLVVGAYGLIFGTRDGGKTWASQLGLVDNPKSRHLYHLAVAGNELLMTGEQGALYRVSEVGQRVTALPSPYAGTLFGALAAPGGNTVVFGLRGNAFVSPDQGGSWTKVDFGPPVTLTAGTRMRDGRWVVADETGRVLVSRNGGGQFVNPAVPKMNAATGVVEAADGSLVLSTQHGAVRVAASALNSEQK